MFLLRKRKLSFGYALLTKGLQCGKFSLDDMLLNVLQFCFQRNDKPYVVFMSTKSAFGVYSF